MSLIPFNAPIGATSDSNTAGGTNYYIGAVVHITDLNDVPAQLFSDRAGAVPLLQNGIDNVTDSTGSFFCFMAAGSYKIECLGAVNEFDHFSSAIGDLSQAYQFSNIPDMIAGNPPDGGSQITHLVGKVYCAGKTKSKCINAPVTSIFDFTALSDIYIEDFGLDDTAFSNALDYSQSSGMPIRSAGGKTFTHLGRISKAVDNLDLDMNGSTIVHNYTDQASPAITIKVNETASIKNVIVNGQNMVHRPFAIEGTSTRANIITENIRVINTYGSTVGALSVIGIYIFGLGKSLSMLNTTIENVDSVSGRTSTAGIFASRAVSNSQGFVNVSIVNTTLKNITEQGGSTINDSDGIKVFGPNSQEVGSPLKTNCLIDNVYQWNESGLGCKRIIKTQCQQYTVKNVTGIFSNCSLVSAVDNQYGSGSCDNINLELDTVNVSAGIVNQPQFKSSNAPNDSGCSITNVSVQGVNCTANILTQAFFSSDRKTSRTYRNWNISGFTYTNFGVIQSDNDESFSIYENINLTDSIITGDSAFLGREGQGASIERNYISSSFVNFQTDKIVFAVGLYSGDSTVWTRFRPVRVQNCTLQFTGYFGEVGKLFNRGNFVNGLYDYKARLPSPKAGGVGLTTIKVRHNLSTGNNYQYQYIRFRYKQLQGAFTSNCEFIVKWSSASSCSAIEVVESFVGAQRLMTPTATYTPDTNPESGDLVITWGTDNTGTASASIEIISTVDITMDVVFGLAV